MAIRLSGINSGLDTDSIVKELVSAYSLKKESYQKEQTKLSWKQEAWKNLNTKIYSLYTKASNMRLSTAYNLKKSSVSDMTKATVVAGNGAVAGTQKLNVLKTAQAGYLTGGELDETVTVDTTLEALGFTGEEASFDITMGDGTTTTVSFNKESTIDDVVTALRDAGLNASFDADNHRFFVSAKSTGTEADFTISATDGNADATSLLTNLGLNTGDDAGDKQATKIDGDFAQIKLNGVTYESNSNSFNINGLSINALSVTGDGEGNAITITTNVDTQGIYDSIKEFLDEYNTVINEITAHYNADSASGYDPLTDEEKDAMSETEIEKWETKIKDSLLRRDSSLDSIMNAMTTAMSKSFEIDGKSYSLSSFGISTLGFLNAGEHEQNAFHIDGDPDDESTSGKTDKLLKAIETDPDTISDFMQQLIGNLYSSIDSKMKSTDMSSAYKVYNDKEMDKQYAQYTKMISDWEEKVADKEDYYYKKFAAMEAALGTLQNQTNSLSSLFGGM